MKICFIMFLPRSGSTLIANDLSSVSGVAVLPETNFFAFIQEAFKNGKFTGSNSLSKFISSTAQGLFKEKKFQDLGLSSDEIAIEWSLLKKPSVKTYIDSVLRLYVKKTNPAAELLLIKKDGWYVKNALWILRTWNNSKIIWLVRHPCGIFNSARKAYHSEKEQPLAKGVARHSIDWIFFMFWMRLLHLVNRSRLLHIQYEAYLINRSCSVNMALEFLSHEGKFDELNVARSPHLINSRNAHLHVNVGKKICNQRADAWRSELSFFTKLIIRLICFRL